MFPHKLTLYIQEDHTDPATLHTETIMHITVLQGVLVDAAQGENVTRNGQTGADSVTVYTPFSVSAVDGVTGIEKHYVSPEEFWQAEDKSGLWSLPLGGKCFFQKGEAVYPGLDRQQIEAKYGRAYSLTRVTERDFGGDMAHWEIGGA